MTNRDKLYFSEHTQAAFVFLEEEFGFIRTHTSSRKVRYETKAVFIETCHGDYDFEVSTAFGRQHPSESERFDFTLFLRLVNPALEKALGERIADNEEKVKETVCSLAKALRSEGIDIIKGRDAVFDRMKNVTWWQFKST